MIIFSAHSITLTYLPDMALANGVSRDQAALLISVCGVTNTVGRIGAGLATDFFRISSTHIYLVALVTASVVNFSFPWCNSFFDASRLFRDIWALHGYANHIYSIIPSLFKYTSETFKLFCSGVEVFKSRNQL